MLCEFVKVDVFCMGWYEFVEYYFVCYDVVLVIWLVMIFFYLFSCERKYVLVLLKLILMLGVILVMMLV